METLPTVTLCYLSTPYKHNNNAFLYDTWDRSLYVPVFKVPKCELIHTSPVNIANDLVDLMLTAYTIKKFNRPIVVGDIFTIDQNCWGFIDTQDKKLFEEADKPTQILLWEQYSIVQLN